MLEFHDIEQNNGEWYAMRAGRVTSSKLSCIMANYGKAFGDPAKRYAKQIANEIITGKPISGGYSNAAMERGHEQEPIARQLYELETFCSVTNGGFFCNESVGCSPDGLVGNDGVVEIKSAESHIHYDRIVKQTYDAAYKWQLVGNLYFTGREWIDFISYCSDYPEGKRLYVYRLWRNEVDSGVKMIESRLSDFFDLIEESKNKINNSVYFITEQRKMVNE